MSSLNIFLTHFTFGKFVHSFGGALYMANKFENMFFPGCFKGESIY